jgi:PncC family amidohydrolase
MVDFREIELGELLSKRGLTISVAESFTGGMIGHVITNAPGSSRYFQGGVIAYANEVKMAILGVAEKTLIAHGAVSRETVIEMARGIRSVLSTDIGISSSGIAGPGGGSAEKPVGLAWIGLSAPHQDYAEQFLFSGDRFQIKQQATQTAIQRVIDFVTALPQPEPQSSERM